MTSTLPKPAQDPESIELLSLGTIVTSVLQESLRLGLYEMLQTPQTCAQVATALGVAPGPMAALLGLLEAQGLLLVQDGAYTNSPVASEFLVSSSPFYQGDCLRLHEATFGHIATDLSDLLRSPAGMCKDVGCAFAAADRVRGVLQYAMRGSLQDAVAIIGALPGFGEMRRMCDVGGNHGRYSTALLDLNTRLCATIVDLPAVAAAVEETCRGAGYGQRLAVVPCDLRADSLPRGEYDLVLASHVLHILGAELETVVGRLAHSLAPGGWFVTQSLNPQTGASAVCRAAMDLVAALTVGTRHVVDPKELERILRPLGFTDFRTAATGPRASNLLLAARKR